MKRLIGSAIGLVLLLAVKVQAQSTKEVTPLPEGEMVTIPLDEIWGYELPGTLDMRELEPKRDVSNLSHKEYLHGSQINLIAAMLHRVPKEKAGPAFVVVGTGSDALKNAHTVFLDRYKGKSGKESEKPLPNETELSLVFYCHLVGWHLRIESVEQTPETITIKYQRVPSSDIGPGGFTEIGDSSPRFALIPIGKYSEGKVRVKIEEIPSSKVKGPKPERYVSSSFDFEVR